MSPVQTVKHLSGMDPEVVHDKPIALDDFSKFTAGLKELVAREEDPVIRSFVIQSVVSRIDVHPEGIEIHFHVGQSHYRREFGGPSGSLGSRPFFVLSPTQDKSALRSGSKKTVESPPGLLSQEKRFPRRGTKPLEKYFEDRCSNSLKNGGPGATTDALSPNRAFPHDIIRFFQKTKDHIFEICAPLYERGLSLREIEEQTGFAKSSIRETLRSRGLTLRNASKRQANTKTAPVKSRSPINPYGYAWLNGKLVVDPSEYKVVLQVARLWKSGKSLTAIAKHLNEKKIPTRMGKGWSHTVVGAIVKRHLEQEKKDGE